MITLAGMVLAALAASANADVIYANTGNPVGNSGSNSGALGTATFSGNSIPGNTGDLDTDDSTNGLTLNMSAVDGGQSDYRFEWFWYTDGSSNDVANGAGDIKLLFFIGNIGSNITAVNITDIVFIDNNNNSITASLTLGTPLDLTANGANNFVVLDLNPGSFTTAGGFDTNFLSYTKTYIDLDITGSGAFTGGANDVFQIDAIAATPEPGSLALFGLGLCGIGVVVRRRKRKRAAARKSA